MADLEFNARFEERAAPATCAAFRRQLAPPQQGAKIIPLWSLGA